MKSKTLHIAAGLLLSTAPFSLLSCKKSESSAAPAENPAAETSAPAPSTVNDPSSWGFAARLPKNTEGFIALYNAGSLVQSLLNSNWFKKVKTQKAFGAEIEAGLSQLESDPQASVVLSLVKEIAGKEIVFVLSEGASAQLTQYSDVSGAEIFGWVFSGVGAEFPMLMDGDPPPPESIGDSLPPKIQPSDAVGSEVPFGRDARLKFMEFAAKVEAPPLMLAVKAVSAKAQIDKFITEALAALPAEVRAVVEEGTFTVGDGIEFKSLAFSAAKMPVKLGAAEAELKEMTEHLGSEKKAADMIASIRLKKAVAAWGWVGDYLVLSLGKDHSHVKFSAPGDSVLSTNEMSSRVAEWQAKKPFALGYLSQAATRNFNGGSVVNTLVSIVELAAGQSPIPLAPLIADMKKLGGRYLEVSPNDADAIATAAWWDGGLQAESYGGAKPRSFDSSKPLSLTGLAGPTTIMSATSRVNEAERDKTFTFLEEISATVWESYQKNIKPGLPQEMAAQTGLAEAIGIPMIKNLWKGIQDFRGSLGSESVLMVDLDGAMPALPNMPPNMEDIKIPRILFASELKDPAKLSASWKGLGDLMGSVIALSEAPIDPKPTEKKDGDLTSWGWDLPMDLGDIWPHAAVSSNRWFLGTSPSLTKAAAGAAPAASGPAVGAHLRVNFTPLWKFAAALLPMSPTNGPGEMEAAEGVLGLIQAVSELTATTGESAGMSHTKLHVVIKDTP